VIDLGLPGEENSGLPPFFIPYQGLGEEHRDYAHVRLRVHRGAYLHIEADNTAYIARGAASDASCAPGDFNDGTVEVMAGGKLRDGAYQGFPLGDGAVILARLNSYLAVGPESSFSSSNPDYAKERDRWFSGWLLGSASGNPRIEWGVGDQNGDYLEIRQDRLAFSTNLTVKKTLALAYSVWFINGPSLTLDAAGDTLSYEGGVKGLFARPASGGSYTFYGTRIVSGGQNPARPAAQIIIKPGNSLSRSFVFDDDPSSPFITASDGQITIDNTNGKEDEKVFFLETETGTRWGFNNWELP
jgi:hypothetical protein